MSRRHIDRNDRSWFRVCFANLGAVLFLCSSLTAAESPGIALDPGAVPKAAVEVRGLPAEVLRAVRELPQDDPAWSRILSVRVKGQTDDRPPILGKYMTTETVIRFQTRFPFERGLDYRIVFDSASLPKLPRARIRIEQDFRVAKSPPDQPARLVAIFPSAGELPENLLRVYLHFSAPMQQGDSYRHVRIVEDSGKIIDRPFLQVPQELWNAEGTRLTLLLDPGRVKEGLKPRAEAGQVLFAGRRYTLEVDTTWLDAAGNALAEAGRKTFRVTPPDVTQPDPKQWKVTPPRPETRDPLLVQFPEPLDEAMLHRALAVVASNGEEVAGVISVSAGESQWQFTPKSAWTNGAFRIRISSTLEDRVGNSIARPFEVDLRDTAARPPVPDVLTLHFSIPKH